MEEDEDQKVVSGTSSNDSGNSGSDDPKIKEIETNNVRSLNSLPMVAFRDLAKMKIVRYDKVESLSEVEGVFRGCSSSLRFLEVIDCNNLRSISRGLEHLATLESLKLARLPELRFDNTGNGMPWRYLAVGNGIPWRCLAQCLRSLILWDIREVVELLKGMRYLTALQSLKIGYLPLKDLPQWIACLPSLHSLEITECKYLESLPEALGNLITQVHFQ